jgi:hypothetical protein
LLGKQFLKGWRLQNGTRPLVLSEMRNLLDKAVRPDDQPTAAAPHFEGLEFILIGATIILFGIAAYLWI